ncbi:MAG: spermidine/putrescine ABC transporter substrate-binding protein [Acidimicrobiales bacterium]
MGAAGYLGIGCGDDDDTKSAGPEAKQLNFYNWTDYVADDTIPGFTKATGIKVTYDNYSSNDDLFAKLRQGSAGYDLIVPTDNFVVKMIDADLLESLDLALIPNRKNLDDRFQDADYDPGNKYSIPWQWGTTGIGYDPSKVGQEVDDWDALMMPSVRNRSSFLDEARDAFGMALYALGKDPNSTDQADVDEAQKYLISLKKRMKQITSDYQEPLKSGGLIMSQAYSGDVFQVQAENDAVTYVIPKSGAFQWVDAMCIPKGAEHPKNAHEFMNYILEPKVGAALTNYVQYGTPNKAALPFVDEEVKNDPLKTPPASVLSELVFQAPLGEKELIIADAWTKVKTS